ncbi:glycoside hydrolase family 99-like domain-containing protein [Planktothrix agardhii]|uniref:glycoside hydrolase family 99-like domain-containing protein n=1 Tax=Planktothrix agardhii TaxID=1160 RepID=UPI001F3CCA0E|nr:glycoside hydrolase family 99-like domain-containing protein [Planktothrix agardhii]MCF3576835.1 glycoside hydrolase family 99-like domain-containing protein [Planktothrix agardhii 1812]MCF3646700.1 glycoside hydrolase family 99-like domain-containing protein [Planktothrix agardhii 1026]
MTVSNFRQANQLLRDGKLEDAVAIYQKAIDQNPNFYLSHHNLGEVLWKFGRLEEAATAFQKAIELKPSAAWSYFNLAQVLEQLGREDEAIASYEKASELNPQLLSLRQQLEASLINDQPVIPDEDIALLYPLAEYQKLELTQLTIQPRNKPKLTNDVRLIAYYLPQFHPIPENDLWWGKGFTEWTNVTKAQPLFEGHYQPKLPADLGFYDLRLPEVRDAQARLAKKYGIYGFCYYYYWFAGKRLLERPLDEILQSKHPDFPFCLCWANENWTRRWDGLDNEILIAQEHSFENNQAFAESLVPFIKDERYIRVNGKPLVLIYRANILPDIEETVKLWRDIWRKNDLGEVYLCGCLTFGLKPEQLIKWGLDAGVQFPPHGVGSELIPPATLGAPDYQGNIYDFRQVVENGLKIQVPSAKEFLGVITSWDNTARKGKSGNVFLFANPKMYELWLSGVIEKTKQIYTGDERLVFINAWNEWAEGTYLEPDRKYGHQYLQATSKALNETYSLQTAFGLLRYLPIQTKEHLTHLITQLELRINNLEKSIESMIKMAKIDKQKYVFFEDIQFIDLDNTPTYLDSPSQGNKFNFLDDITLSGWSFDKKGQEVIELKIVDQQREIIRIPLGEERSDVYNAYPECQQLNTGFFTQIKAKNLLDYKESCQLDIYAIFPNNQSIKVVNINLKIIEEEKKISGQLTTRIKWYYTYKENISQLIVKLYELPSSNLEFKHLSDEIEEMINYHISLLNSLKEIIFS